MSKFWSSLFGKKTSSDDELNPERGPHMPREEVPIETVFAEKFTHLGGRFIYCEDIDQAKEGFQSIIDEYPSEVRELLCLDSTLAKRLDVDIVLTKTNLNAKIMLCSCESLVAYDGSIVVCEKQLGTNKIADLPETLIILAGTRQFSKTVSDALKNIKHRYADHIPLNITSIKQFKTEVVGDDNYMNYGSGPKKVYLLLQEDF